MIVPIFIQESSKLSPGEYRYKEGEKWRIGRDKSYYDTSSILDYVKRGHIIWIVSSLIIIAWVVHDYSYLLDDLFKSMNDTSFLYKLFVFVLLLIVYLLPPVFIVGGLEIVSRIFYKE